MFGRKPKWLFDLETDRDIKIMETYKEYYMQLGKRLQYTISPLTSQLRTVSRKITIKYMGLLTVYKIVDPHNYLLITLDGKLVRGLFEHERLKPAVIRTNHSNMTNLSKLREIMALGLLE